MGRTLNLILAGMFLAVPILAVDSKLDPLDQWAQWRGPLGTGIAPRGNPPMRWSEEVNVRWKSAIPGRGQSTPIVWGDRVFITTAIPHGRALEVGDEPHGSHHNMPPERRHEFVVLAYDRHDGKILWKRKVQDERPHESTHVSASWASQSAATDGEHLIVSFGSRGIYGLDLDGKLLWQFRLGNMQVKHGHGEGSSPALHGDTVVVNWDHEGESFVVALDKRTGKQKWRQTRQEGTSWSSPLIVEHGRKTQVIIAATHRVRGYDLTTGEVIWECGGLSGNVVASPVAGDGIVYVANSYDSRNMLAIRLADAKGDITGTDAVIWTLDRHTPYVPSPVLHGDTLCFLKHYQGVLTCVDAKTGVTRFGPRRLEGIENVYASLAGTSDRFYVSDLDGTTVVFKPGEALEVLARNQFDDSFAASPAIVGDELLLRGAKHLYCIGEDSGVQDGGPTATRPRNRDKPPEPDDRP